MKFFVDMLSASLYRKAIGMVNVAQCFLLALYRFISFGRITSSRLLII